MHEELNRQQKGMVKNSVLQNIIEVIMATSDFYKIDFQ